MLAQAAALALLASLSPTALLITAVYLGSAEPRRTALAYLVGATVMSLVTGVVILEILRSTGLSHPAEHGPRYGFRLGLGLLLLVAGAVVAGRRRPEPDPSAAPGGRLAKMTARPAPFSAFLVGMLLFAPGVTFLAAVQVIATAQADVAETILAVILVVVLNVLLVWLPIVLYFLAPARTGRNLMAFNGWLGAHGHLLAVWVLLVVGAILVGNGIYGLA
jgi:Sap, sulfolipid-1-addressing protein